MVYKTGWGKDFFDEHMQYIAARDMDGMVRNTYSPDAALYNAFPVLADAPPPNVIRGTEALIGFFNLYLDYQGEIVVDRLYNFLDSEEVISFQAVITSKVTGQWAVSDTWVMSDEKIYRHFGTAHKL